MEKIEDIYELSPMQQGLLFHTLATPASGVYFEQLSCVLHGSLDLPAFKRAWQQVIARHSILRTAFYWEGLEKPLQIVRPSAELPWEEQDWSGLTPAELDARLAAFLQADRARGFALDQAPLMRCALMRIGEQAHRLIWSHSHLLLDGWSMPIVLREVFAHYEAAIRGQRLQLARARPYREYITWLQAQDSAGAAAFWREALVGFAAPTPLVVGREPGAAQGPIGDAHATHCIHLPSALTASLQAFAHRHHLTLNTLVQASWALLLSRYSGEADVLFGVTSAGRPATLPGVESMVGLFINTLPVRVRVPADQPVAAWLKTVQAEPVEREQYGYNSLVEIQGWSAVPRGTSLFESIMVFENYPLDASQPQPNGLTISDVRGVERTNYPLSLAARPGAMLSLEIGHDSRRFDADTIARLAGHLETLLAGLAADPDRRLADLPLLTAAEERQLLVEWNATAASYPADRCFHELFEDWAGRTPDAVAVTFQEQRLTYAELDRRANQLAHHLQRRGVGPETIVGLCVERSPELIVGLLGILKAGAAYLPLDPSYPPDRLAFMLADAGVTVLLTDGRRKDEGGSFILHPSSFILLDADWPLIAQEPPTAPPRTVTPDNLAYVIYTSGSTGAPKGVLLAHRGLSNVAQAQADCFGVGPGDRVLQFSALSFDAATFEIVLALSHGATLCLAPRATLLPGPDLARFLAAEGITVVVLPPSALTALPAVALPRLRTITVAGEACGAELVRRWAPGRRFFNLYGPTETTIWATVAECRDGSRPPPIGRPIANTQLYVLDAQRRPVPIGVPGELYIGGVGVARGYLNRPELTAERFILHPSSFILYRTGDLVRYLPDGNLEFLGRLDQQVKVRGFRIELGEIEAVLGQHPGVREAVVVAREEPAGKRLVAYIVPAADVAPAVGELRRFLADRLPEYMLPAAFVVLVELPRLPGGKVDRRALPAPEGGRPELAQAYVAPRTPVEQTVAGIWAELLRLPQVGVHDNFFELGGHSLLATQVVSRLREAFDLDLPLQALFEAPTVAGLAERVETLRWAASAGQDVAAAAGEDVDEGEL